jgi:tetratricopeptide (TPR) repeat protein
MLDAWPPLEAWLHATDAPAINNRGVRLHQLKRFEQAVTLFDRAIELAPTSAIAFVNRGNSLAALRRVDEALADYERALVLEPDNVQARENCLKLARQPERDDRKGD